MNARKKLYTLAWLLPLCCMLSAPSACADRRDLFPIPQAQDGRSYSLSSDTIHMDTLPSLYLSSTYNLRIYNPGKQAIKLKHIALKGGEKRGYQINVDGRAGIVFDDVEIAPRDSVFVFVRASLPEGASDLPTEVKDSILIREHTGRESYIPIIAVRLNVERRQVLHITSDTELTSPRALLIEDSILIDQGARLLVKPPARLLMASDAYMKVNGRLEVRASAEQPVRIGSLRWDQFLPRIPYTRVAGQWGGIILGSSATADLQGLHLTNSKWGIYLEQRETSNDEPVLRLDHCRLHNISGVGISANRGLHTIHDSEISNTLASCLSLSGGRYEIARSSIINYYPWPGVRAGAAIVYRNTSARGSVIKGIAGSRLSIRHSVVDGSMRVATRPDKSTLGGELDIALIAPVEQDQVRLSECYLRSIDYSSRVGCQVEQIIYPDPKTPADSLYMAIGVDAQKRRDYFFDFRPRPRSPFLHQSQDNRGYTDLSGLPRSTPMSYGAYEYMATP
ncbi:MAG: hypothetical protein Q4A64_00660 [Porphyromonadaceae bacterium]|nr:hypothetical protein [Porphyromonadaceae bacterium]